MLSTGIIEAPILVNSGSFLDPVSEFGNTPLQEHCLKSFILHRMSCVDTQAQNGVAERQYQHMIEMIRFFLVQYALASQCWVEATYAAVNTINQLPAPLLDNKSPYENLFGRISDYGFFCTFGYECFSNFIASKKLQPRFVYCVFFGICKPIQKIPLF